MLVNSPLWIIYDGIIGSWAGILDEIVTEVSMIVSIFRFGWENLDSVSGHAIICRRFCQPILKLKL